MNCAVCPHCGGACWFDPPNSRGRFDVICAYCYRGFCAVAAFAMVQTSASAPQERGNRKS